MQEASKVKNLGQCAVAVASASPERMNLLHHHVSRARTLKTLAISHHFTRTPSASTAILPDVQSPTKPVPVPSPSHPTHDHAKSIATRLSDCTTLPQVNQIHARIIRTHLLHYCPASFLWNSIIKSYTRQNAPAKALQVYMLMSRAGVLPDSYTLPIVLKAACQVFGYETCRQIHSAAVRLGMESNEYCESGFISFYAKFRKFEDAHKVFNDNPHRKLGSWNAVIGGLSQGGRSKDAIGMFKKMRRWGFAPDDVTMVSVASACGSLGDLNLALQLHKYVFHVMSFGKTGTLMLNSLVDMYGKCGRMDLAERTLTEMEEKNVSSWTSMIVGYAVHGLVSEAIEYLHRMVEAGVRPNHVTFLGVLSACTHGGKVEEGRYFFNTMISVYGINPQLKHYGCMVDLLGRVGLLEEAREMVERMPMNPSVVIWGSLMGACEKYGNVVMGEWVAKHMLELEPWNDGAYVVLSNIYASRGLWEDVERVRLVMQRGSLAKLPAYSLAPGSN